LMKAPKQQYTVKPTVNTRNFLANMKYIFAGSFSVLSELMQNARRAKASRIDFTFDAEAKRLTITDDGVGIDDFYILVRLCDSGWDEQTQDAEEPFGMGFFATFFACEKVTIESNGSSMTASLEDIEQQRGIAIESADQNRGTKIVMDGLDEALLQAAHSRVLGKHEQYQLFREVAKMSLGFPIPVFINGTELERPHAQSALKGITFDLGFFSVDHIHNDKPLVTLDRYQDIALYLQGLPIEGDDRTGATVVVHLDSQRFKAVMPDRKHLYDATAQLDVVRKSIWALVAEFLQKKKDELSAVEFVERYWSDCQSHRLHEFGTKKLLNDIPYIPAQCLRKVEEIQCSPHDRRRSSLALDVTVVSRDDAIISKAWRDAPNDVNDGPNAGGLLKFMQREGISEVVTMGLDPGHWIFAGTPSCNDMEVHIGHDGVLATRLFGLREDVEVRLVKQLTLRIQSPGRPEIVHLVENDWVVQLEQHGSDDDSWFDTVCYVMTEDSKIDHPVSALDAFLDEHDNWDEDREWATIHKWDSMVVAMRGGNLHQAVAFHVKSMHLELPETVLGQMILVYAQSTWRDWSTSFGSGNLQTVDIEDAAIWDRLAKELKAKSAISGEDLKALFMQAAQVEARFGKPETADDQRSAEPLQA
jgi:hypothetical protein